MATKTITEVIKPGGMTDAEYTEATVRLSYAEKVARDMVVERKVEEPHDPHAEDRARMQELIDIARYGDMTPEERRDFDECHALGGASLSPEEQTELAALWDEQREATSRSEHMPAFCVGCNTEHPVPHGKLVAPGIVEGAGLEGGMPFCPGCDEWTEPRKQLRLQHLAGRPTPTQANRLTELKKKRRPFTPSEAAEHQTLKARLEG